MSKRPAKFIAVDFDGTLTVGNRFPNIGPANIPNIHVIEQIISMYKDRGYRPILILWTCREDWPDDPNQHFLSDAVNWCNENVPFKFDYINENPECDFGRPHLVRKIVADLYIDDKSLNPIGCNEEDCIWLKNMKRFLK